MKSTLKSPAKSPVQRSTAQKSHTQKNPAQKSAKKIIFLTGTRADFSKMKSLMLRVDESAEFELCIFVTGMHMSAYFGATYGEVEKSGFKNIFKFINHDRYYQSDAALASTADGFSKFLAEYKPDLVVVHGDRIEPLAVAAVCALNNVLIAHIEGGEVSGTIDDSIRHAISKLAHIHLVNDAKAKKRLLQLGEDEKSIFIIGSPDLDILQSSKISLVEAKKYYDIDFENYALAMFHPVTTEFHTMSLQARVFVDALIKSGKNYIVIYPNNDLGFEFILKEYERLKHDKHFKIFASIRFEYFIALLKNADFAIGNSSAILKEAVFFKVPGINIGTRQSGRAGTKSKLITNAKADKNAILQAINELKPRAKSSFKLGSASRSDEKFIKLLESGKLFKVPKQKKFNDLS